MTKEDDHQLQRFYDCQNYLMGKVDNMEIGNGYTDIKSEFKALQSMLRKYYAFEYTTDGLKAI